MRDRADRCGVLPKADGYYSGEQRASSALRPPSSAPLADIEYTAATILAAGLQFRPAQAPLKSAVINSRFQRRGSIQCRACGVAGYGGFMRSPPIAKPRRR